MQPKLFRFAAFLSGIFILMLSAIICLSLYSLSLKNDLNKANEKIEDLNRLNKFTISKLVNEKQ